MITDKLKIRLKKFALCLVASLALMSSLCLSVSAEVATYNYTDHTVYRYVNEPVTAYALWLEDLGDLSYHLNKTTCYSFYLNDGFTISGVKRDTDGNITSLSLSFSNYEQKTFIETSSYTDVIVYPLSNSQRTSSYFSIYASSPDFCYINWNKAVVSMASGIAEGETFTYYDPNGVKKSVTFDGEGGVVGFTDLSGSTTLPSAPDMLDFTDINDYIGGITGSAPDYSDYNINLPDSDFETDDIVPAALRILLFIQQIPKLLNFFIDTVVYYLSNIKEILVALFQYINGNLVIAVINIDSILKYIGELVTTGIQVAREIVEKQFEFDFDLDLSGILDGISALKTITEETLKNTIVSHITGFTTTFADIKGDLTTLVKTDIPAFKTRVENLPDEITTAMETMFLALLVPSDGYLESAIDVFTVHFERCYPIVITYNTIMNAIESSNFSGNSLIFTLESEQIVNNTHNINITLPALKMDFEIIQEIRKYTDPIIVAISYFSAILFFKNQLPVLFGGVGGGTAAIGDTINQINMESQKNGR